MTVRGTDPDKGDNGTVRYKITDGPDVGWQNKVAINGVSGTP